MHFANCNCNLPLKLLNPNSPQRIIGQRGLELFKTVARFI
ncbi:hypothetical protein D1AOALGA4SA_6789 [Olavius algarvensis Delta 1 endosymbiont]|nr:hypothetical protein D1AOALGA4SA_6789 [Olavius algarvensis Delta 1 endosymbiont]